MLKKTKPLSLIFSFRKVTYLSFLASSFPFALLPGGSSAAGMPKIVKGGICAQKGNLSCPKMVWGSYENRMLRVPGLAAAVKEMTGKEAISSDATGEVAKNSSAVLDQRERENTVHSLL